MSELNNIGVVIKVCEDEAVIITDESVFERIRRTDDMFLGQKILINEKDLINRKRLGKNYFYIVAAGIAAVFALIIAFSFLWGINNSSPYVYVSIDINPSMELGINNEDKISNVSYLNKDAENLGKNLKLKGLNIYSGLKEIIKKSKECGFMQVDKDKNIILITAALYKGGAAKVNEQKDQHFTKFLNILKNDLEDCYGDEINLKVVNVPAEYHEKSIKQKISMGKYLLYSEAKKAGAEISMQELKSDSLYKLYNIIGFKPDDKNSFNTVSKATLTPTSGLALTNTNTAPNESTPSRGMSPTPLPVNVNALPTTSAHDNPTINSPIVSSTLIPLTPKSESELCGGLKGEYYDNSDFTNLKMTRIDPEINYRWVEDSPDPIIGADTFSVRWTGLVEPKYTEKYTFYTFADDGARVWVNNVLIIDNWKSQRPVESHGSIELTAGTKYDIRIEFFENVKSCQIKMYWSSNSQKKEIIPSSQLYHYGDVYQSENAIISRSVTESTNTGYSGIGYVNFNNETGSYVEWVVNTAKSGLYTLNFWYSNGTKINRPLEIKVNNDIVTNSLDFNSTDKWTYWKNGYCKVNLKAGKNIIRATAVTENGGPNIDYMEIL
ncbi:MAG: PA14 domain-containing protein [Bacillota bacterium]|nr:PA14 domain-containing protein [Bacillota bacterium]